MTCECFIFCLKEILNSNHGQHSTYVPGSETIRGVQANNGIHKYSTFISKVIARTACSISIKSQHCPIRNFTQFFFFFIESRINSKKGDNMFVAYKLVFLMSC